MRLNSKYIRDDNVKIIDKFLNFDFVCIAYCMRSAGEMYCQFINEIFCKLGIDRVKGKEVIFDLYFKLRIKI